MYDPVKNEATAYGMVDSAFKEKKLNEAYDMVHRERSVSNSIEPREYQDVLYEEMKAHQSQVKSFQTGIE